MPQELLTKSIALPDTSRSRGMYSDRRSEESLGLEEELFCLHEVPCSRCREIV